MSIFTALRAGVSGLSANASALAAISDNIANTNTIGYKRVQAEFNALVSTSDPNSTIFNAGGVTASTRHFISQQGPTEQTASSTDLALIGDGFFIVTDDESAQTGAGGGLFTRAGSFNLDGNGRLVNAQGLLLLGAPILDGQTDPNPTSLAALQPINLAGVGANAEATRNLAINANLDSRQVTAATPYVLGSFTTGAQVPQVERSIELIDSLGTPRSLTLGFNKVATNEWQLEVFIRPDSLVDNAPALDLDNDPLTAAVTPPPGYIVSGRLQFNSDGQLVSFVQDGQPAPAQPVTSIQLPLRWAAETGADPTTVVDFDVSAVSQLAIPSSLDSATADGSVPGDLVGVSVSRDGVLSAQFSNGQTEQLYLIPIATFLNPNGLAPDRDATFRITPNSGIFTLNTPGQGGAGVLQANALESSNVDLGAEFANLIVTQRAYSASSQIIQTADQLLQELINIPN